jgi:excisionase family DNA binding protein
MKNALPPPSWPKPISREEFAELVGVHVGTVRRWEANGLIRTVRIGKQVRVPPSEIQRILEHGIDLNSEVEG